MAYGIEILKVAFRRYEKQQRVRIRLKCSPWSSQRSPAVRLPIRSLYSQNTQGAPVRLLSMVEVNLTWLSMGAGYHLQTEIRTGATGNRNYD